ARRRSADARREVAERRSGVGRRARIRDLRLPAGADLSERRAGDRAVEARVDGTDAVRRAVGSGAEERTGIAEAAALERALAAESRVGAGRGAGRREGDDERETSPLRHRRDV